MKKFWKALGIAALATAVPVRIKKDEETGKTQYQSLLLSVDVTPGEDGAETSIAVNIGEGLINSAIMSAVNAKKEAQLFTDDPDEAVLFADDEPEAAVVDIAEQAEAAAEEAEAKAGELEAKVEEFEAKAEEAEAAADEAEAVEEDFDPDL